ncbi:MAG: hypothetical protein KJ760_19975 [Proteobacteria bacterium]|nr:hypothetical protein [Pseudomonadota bacterium]
MAVVISQINALEKIYQNGLEDSYLDRAINKIVTYEINNTQKDIEVLKKDLTELEKKFDMDSSTFFEKWKSGLMGDDADSFEWSALYQMFLRAKRRLELLGANE